MSNFFQSLNFPEKFNFNLPEEDLTLGQKMFFSNSKDVIPDNFFSYFKYNFDLSVEFLLVFQQAPGTESNIHLDGINNTYAIRHAALNFIITNPDCYMSWYNIKKESKIYHVYPGKSIITHYEEDMVEEVIRKNISGCNIVRTDVPHKVVNSGNTTRWCVSVRFNKNFTFEEYKELFKNFIGNTNVE